MPLVMLLPYWRTTYQLMISRYAGCQIRAVKLKNNLQDVWVYIKNFGSVIITLYHAAEFKQRSTIPSRLGFSNAAATLSLSPSCLFTAASDE